MNGRACAMAGCVLALGVSVSVRAQEVRIPVQEPPDAARYTLAECLRIALENNLDLVVARKDPRIAAERIEVTKAPFDGTLGAALNYTQFDQDQRATGGGSEPTDSDSLSASISWNHLLNYGGRYDVTVSSSTFDQTSRQIDVDTGLPEDSTVDVTTDGLTVRYDMPLLRGFGVEVNTVDILLARSGLTISHEDLRLQAILTLKAVEDAYWNLLAARAALGVARESLDLAQDLYELNRKKVEVGTLAPIEITQAEAGVASREEGVIVAETGVANAEDTLRQLMAIPRDDPLWSRPIMPADRPQFEERSVDFEAAIATALEHRPEMARARVQLRDSELTERVNRKGLRHTLDLSAALTPEQEDSEFAQTLPFPINTTLDTDRRDWRVGLVYAYPVGNRLAKANYAIASLNREKSEVALQSVEQDIRVDVRTAARNVESGAKRVAAARSSTVLQRKTLEAEQKKFENGMSTSFEVLRIQTDLSDAQLAEIRAILDYTKALADLERAQGTLLEARGLSIQS